MNTSRITLLLAVVCGAAVAARTATGSTPPIYNYDYDGSGQFYAAVNSQDYHYSPTLTSVGWPSDGELVSGWWEYFSPLFYYQGLLGSNFIDMPLLNPLPTNGGQDYTIAPYCTINLAPYAGLDRIREIPLEANPRSFPAVAAARYKITLNSSSRGNTCEGAIFFLTAEYDPSVFDVTIYGQVRSGDGSYNCSNISLAPYQPRLIIDTPFNTNGNNNLRYDNLILNPQYVKVALKPGRNPRDVEQQPISVVLCLRSPGSGNTDHLPRRHVGSHRP